MLKGNCTLCAQYFPHFEQVTCNYKEFWLFFVCFVFFFLRCFAPVVINRSNYFDNGFLTVIVRLLFNYYYNSNRQQHRRHHHHKYNRLFPSSPMPPFQSEAKCEVFVALRLALKERLKGTRKWPIL